MNEWRCLCVSVCVCLCRHWLRWPICRQHNRWSTTTSTCRPEFAISRFTSNSPCTNTSRSVSISVISGHSTLGRGHVPPDSLVSPPDSKTSWIPKCRPMWSSYFLVLENGQNGLGDEGLVGQFPPPPRNLGLEPPVCDLFQACSSEQYRTDLSCGVISCEETVDCVSFVRINYLLPVLTYSVVCLKPISHLWFDYDTPAIWWYQVIKIMICVRFYCSMTRLRQKIDMFIFFLRRIGSRHAWYVVVGSYCTTVSMADHQCTSAVSVHRSSLFPFVLGFALLTMMTWLYHVLGPRVMVRAVSASRHPRFGTCYHLISRTLMLVANSSSRALTKTWLFVQAYS